MKTISNYKKILYIVIFLLVVTFLIILSKQSINHIREYSQKLDLKEEANLLESKIISESFHGVDKVLNSLINDEEIIAVLKRPHTNTTTANAVLNAFNSMAQGSITYILDTLGNVCLSTSFISNGKQATLLNKNYSFRPYFSKAMNGEPQIYPAVGVTTNKRGIYFSHPIYNENKIIGVGVIKMNTALIQHIIDKYQEKILIITPEDIVFISNQKDWLYGTTNINNQQSIQKLNASKQFHNQKIKPLPFNKDDKELVTDDAHYLLFNKKINIQNWHILIMTPFNPVKRINPELGKIIYVGFTLVSILLTTILLLLYTNRTRRLTKLVLAESSEDLRITLNSIGDAVIATDAFGNITRINPSACKLIGYSDKDCLGNPFENFITLRDERTRSLIESPLKRIKENTTEQLTRNNRILISKSEKAIPVSETASSIKNKNNTTTGYVLVYRDISKTFNLKQKLQENQFHLRKIIDFIPQSIAIVNEEGTLLLNNKTFEQLTGTNAKLLNSKKETSLYRYSDYFEKSQAINKEVIDSGVKKTIAEDIFKDKNGNVHIFQTTKLPFNYYQHRAVLTVSSNISNRIQFQDKLESSYKEMVISNQSLAEINKKLESQYQELIETKEDLEISNKLKTVFLQNISHEIRTPLNGIISFTELAINENVSLKERYEQAETITKSTNQLLNVIEDILEISKIETKQVKPSKKTILPIKFIEDIYSKFSQSMNDSIIFKTDFEHAEKSFSIISDSEILNKIINHLLNNAFKFTEKGEVIIGCHTNQDYITFFIKDTGIGIPQEKLAVIFEYFNQITDESKVSSWLGLGLTIAKRYTELINGTMWVESQVNKGSTFYVKFPVCF